jgi:ribonuclease HII
MKVCGIDEAGRGPVIGPLVMAGISIDENKVKLLEKLEVKDSKMLTLKRREFLFEEIKAITDYHIIIVDPMEIDAALNNPDLNLNKLEAIKIADVIDNLKPNKAIIDAPSTNTEAFKKELRKLIQNKETELVLEHKADENYAVCSAASILAKVTRDRKIEKIKEKHGNCGSGYPSDPTTRKYLQENWKKPINIFRKTWATYKKLESSKKQKSIAEY